jgi:hypothetical protein
MGDVANLTYLSGAPSTECDIKDAALLIGRHVTPEILMGDVADLTYPSGAPSNGEIQYIQRIS